MQVQLNLLQIDTDNDGVVDFDEFLQMMTKHRLEERSNYLQDLSDAFDVSTQVQLPVGLIRRLRRKYTGPHQSSYSRKL